MRRRIFAGFLALAMMLTVIPATDVHAETVSENQIEQTVSGNSVEQEKEVEETKEVKNENVDLSQVPATMSETEGEPEAQAEAFLVTTYEELLSALDSGAAKVEMANDITADASANSGYGKAGAVLLEAGDVLDGKGHKLTINGANTTWDCAVAMKGGEVRNLTISGAFRGVFMPGAGADVVIDNCILDDVTYTFNSDAGSKDYSVTIKNTTLKGWTSFTNAHKSVTFENCTFGEGRGYAFCRPYQATTFIDCKFNEGFEVDTRTTGENALEFTNCTYNGEALSSENNDMFFAGGSVIINGNATDVNHYVAEVGGTKYETLEEAVVEANGKTVVLLDDIKLEGNDGITVESGQNVVLDLNGKTLSNLVDEDRSSYVILNKGSLTIKDSMENGKITNDVKEGTNAGEWWSTPQYNYATNVITNCGTLTIESGIIEQTAASSICYAIDNNSSASSATTTIKGGTIKAIKSAMRMFVNSETLENNMIISGGKIEADYCGFWVQIPGAKNTKASVTITGGEILANSYSWYDYSYGGSFDNFSYNVTGGKFEGPIYSYGVEKFITGGTFDGEVYAPYIADGYEAVQDGDNWIVGKHNPKPVAEVDSTCTTTGTKAHYKCDLCGRLYLNATDTEAVTEAALVKGMKAHTPAAELVNVKAATCTAEGYTGDEVCSVCGTTTKAGTAIAALGHNFDEKTGTCKNNCGAQIIVDAGEVDVLVQPEETEHKVSEDIPEDVKEVATEIASSVTTSTESLTKAVEETAETYAKDEELIAQAKEALNVEKDEDVQIIVKPHLEIEIKMVETTEAPEAEKPLVVVEINLVYDVVAKKADGSAEEHLKEVKVTDPGKAIEISFDVSEEIAEMLQEMIASGKKIYIRHPKKNGDVYFHEAKLDGKKVKFTNNAGFSEFTLMYGEKVPENVIVSSGSSIGKTIATNVETGEYIATGSVSQEIIEDGKDELRSLIGDSYGIHKLALAVELKGELSGSAKVKILVDDVTKADSIIILQKTEDGWKAVSTTAGDGYVIGEFRSLSEILIFVNPDGELEAAQTGNVTTTTPAGTTAPAATGDSSMTALWIGVLAIAAVAVVCTFVYNKKRRA